MLETAGLLLVLALAWFWLDGIKARDIAVSVARRACVAESVQFLDESVATASVRPARNEQGSLVLRRIYSFEYSDTGDNRHPGSVMLLGHEVVAIDIGLRLVVDNTMLH